MTRPRRACTELLQWALPRLGLRWEGFIKVRRQVCKRLDRRRQELQLGSVDDYRAVLEADDAEWAVLEAMCRITISRFYRDAPMWDALRDRLPRLASSGPVRCWSAGCASGEEPWTLRLIAGLDPGAPPLEIVATDADPAMLGRARAARYPAGCLRELPKAWVERAFHRSADAMRLKEEWRDGIVWHAQDLRHGAPGAGFDVVLCRNLAFTYFDEAGQRAALDRLLGALRPGGLLIVGRYEEPPAQRGVTSVGPCGLMAFG